MKYKIIDNLLPSDKFAEIQGHMLGPYIEWAYNSLIVRSENISFDKKYDFQFTHTFYRNNAPTSTWCNMLAPVLEFLNPSALVRIKANLQPRTETHIIHEYHLDHNHFDGKIAIFYINTNDGYTIFQDGTKIQSIENRLLIFDPDILHTGTTCTDQQVRCLINFMFYQWTDASI